MNIWNRIKLEVKCFLVDLQDASSLSINTCFRMYKPSFYIRYTPEEQEKIKAEDKKKLLALLDELEKIEKDLKTELPSE